jgi:PAS domain S-box-containing protein
MAEPSRFESDPNQRFQLLVNAVTDYAIYMLDPTGRIATWNSGAARLKGYGQEEILGRHFSDFFTEEDRASGVPGKALQAAARDGRFEAEGWRVRKDGSRFCAHVIIERIMDEGGSLVGFAKITRDVTQKREAQRALYESEQRFRMLVQGVQDYAIYMLDRHGVVTNWNTGAEAIKGYKAEEIVGQHFSRFYTEEDRQGGEPQRALETAVREGRYENEALRVRRDGTTFWANVVVDPIFNQSGELIGFAKITRDVTERRQAEEELEKTRAALFQAQKLQALGELTGGIAHDFNNLMTVIRGSADLMRRENLPDEKRSRYLEAIVSTADRAATLTGHLLAFGRRQPLRPEVINLNVRIDAFAEVLSRTLGETIEVTLDLFPSLWATEVDSAQLETALLNAAVNARDAMPEGGRLDLQTRNLHAPDGDFVCVAVTDSGPGMAEEVLNRAFEPFFTTKPVGKGTGLGLSQIHGFAAQTGGRAEITSKTGEGTTVRILLPRSDKAPAVPKAAVEAPASGEGVRVLLVEDNDDVRQLAESLLEELGYDVIRSACADEALELLDREEIDLIFSDVVMPGRSGVELARIARERRPGIPVLLASGFSEEVVQGAAAEFEVLQKPYDSTSLASALAAALRSGT